jgi:hypothetical protein
MSMACPGSAYLGGRELCGFQRGEMWDADAASEAGRMNVAGLPADGLDGLARAIAAVGV